MALSLLAWMVAAERGWRRGQRLVGSVRACSDTCIVVAPALGIRRRHHLVVLVDVVQRAVGLRRAGPLRPAAPVSRIVTRRHQTVVPKVIVGSLIASLTVGRRHDYRCFCRVRRRYKRSHRGSRRRDVPPAALGTPAWVFARRCGKPRRQTFVPAPRLVPVVGVLALMPQLLFLG